MRPPELQRIYERLRVRDQHVTRRGDFIRQVRSIVKGTGSTLRGGTADAFHRRREEVGEDVRDVVDPPFDVIASCSEAIDRIDARLTDIAKGIPAVERPLGVSGVGPITSLAFYAVIGDPTRFSNIRDVGAYLGMVVRRDDCVDPSEPHELAVSQIAASPTACIQPCARPSGARTDESAESRRDTAASGSRKRASKAPARDEHSHTASADGERGCPREKTEARATSIRVGPQPPPAGLAAGSRNGETRSVRP